MSSKDYGRDGISIGQASLQLAREFPDPASRPAYVLWNGQQVRTYFHMGVPPAGRVRLELLSPPREPRQAVDIKAVEGAIILAGEERVHLLRTWHDPRCEEVVEYPYETRAGALIVYNVYEHRWPNGRVTEERFIGNAGFLLEQESDSSWLFRCSDGDSEPPDFAKLVFRVTGRSRRPRRV